MKKNLHLSLTSVFIILLSIKALAVDVRQTWTWTGASDGTTWSNGGNWSASPVDANQTYPHNYNDALVSKNFIADVTFNGGASPNVDGTYFLNSMAVNSGTVNILSAGTAVRTLTISWAASGAGLSVGSGATLQIGAGSTTGIYLSMGATGTGFEVTATINGTLDIAGTGPTTGGNNPRFLWDSDFSAPYSKVTVGSSGKILLSGTNAVMTGQDKNKLVFLSGATMEITRSGGVVPDADYQTGSFLRVIGTGTTGAALQSNDAASVIYNCDILWDRSSQAAETSFNWPAKTLFGGTFTMKNGFLNIGGSSNTLMTNGTFTMNNIIVQGGALNLGSTATGTGTITGTLDVTGGTFRIGNPPYSSSMTITVNGNVTQSGGTIDVGPNTGTNKLILKSNLSQTAGILTESSTSTASGFTFAGTAIQNFTSTGTLSGNNLLVTINNANNHVNQLSNATLPYRLQCSSGSMILGGTSLTVTEKVFGSRTGGRVVTNLGGTLTLKNVDNVGKDFPVGISTASHDAVWVTNASGTSDFTISVGSTFNPLANLNTTNTLPRQWEITSTSAGANLEFDPDPLAGTQTMTKSIGRYVTSAWVSTGAVIGVNNGYPYSASFTAFTSFVVGATDVIPVELTSFKAQSKGSNNFVEWTTASEINTAYFNLERSADGHNAWQSIGTVKAAGNSNRLLSYNFMDEGPLSISYYRLTTVDADGKKTVSKTVSVNTGKGKLALLNTYPSPAKNVVNLDFDATPNTTVAVALKDMTGRAVLVKNTKITEGSNQLTLDVSGLANGVYILTMNDGVSSIVQRIVKQ